MVVFAAAAFGLAPVAPADVDFAHEVAPLLKQRCAACHANGAAKGDLSIESRETLVASGVVEPGAASASTLIERVCSDDPEFRMPPKGAALTPAEIDVLRRWIDAGLPWDAGFAFRAADYEPPLRPRRPSLPPAEPGFTGAIDRVVLAYWRSHGVEPPPLADDATFIRRASLDLIGLLPTPAEVDAYVADADPHKRAALVRRLLDNRVAYADHWLSFWNDLLRNDYAGAGYIDGGRKQISAWLYRALLENKPYDEFVSELVAPDEESAGFAKGIVWRGQVNASQRPELQFSQNVSQAFLGINMKCASCHDSFVDRWKLSEAYALAAVVAEEPLELHRCDKPTGVMARAAFLFPELGSIDADAPRTARMAQLAKLLTHPENGRLARTLGNRFWRLLLGRGVVHPVDAMNTPPWSADLLDQLAVELTDANYDMKALLAAIATSRVYASQAATGAADPVGAEYVFAGPAAKRLTAEQFVDGLATLLGGAPPTTANDDALVKPLGAAAEAAGARPFVRASLVKATPLMRTLGRPSREQVVSTRPAELTTLEALELSNGQQLAEALEAGARRLRAAQPAASLEAICREAFRQAIGRDPTAPELGDLLAIADGRADATGLADVLWCIVMLPEFQIVR